MKYKITFHFSVIKSSDYNCLIIEAALSAQHDI